MSFPSFQMVEVGDTLPSLDLQLTSGLIIAGAMATRDWQDVHHDKERAQAAGLKDIILSIPTTLGYTARFATDWAGPKAVLKSNKIKLGASAYPGDTLHFSGLVSRKESDGTVAIEVKLVTQSTLHASGEVTLKLSSTKEELP